MYVEKIETEGATEYVTLVREDQRRRGVALEGGEVVRRLDPVSGTYTVTLASPLTASEAQAIREARRAIALTDEQIEALRGKADEIRGRGWYGERVRRLCDDALRGRGDHKIALAARHVLLDALAVAEAAE